MKSAKDNNKGEKKGQKKKNLRQHSVLDWSPTSILSGPCDACLRGSDETRNVHRGMAADEGEGQHQRYEPLQPGALPARLTATLLHQLCSLGIVLGLNTITESTLA